MKFIVWLQLREGAISAETAKLQSQRRVMANRVKRLNGYIAYNVLLLNEPRIETDLKTFQIQAGRDVVEIDDLDHLPKEYVEITCSADNSKLKNALKGHRSQRRTIAQER